MHFYVAETVIVKRCSLLSDVTEGMKRKSLGFIARDEVCCLWRKAR